MDLTNFTDNLIGSQIKSFIAKYNYSGLESFKDTRTADKVYNELFPDAENQSPFTEKDVDAIVVPNDSGFLVIASSLDALKSAIIEELEEHERDVRKIRKKVIKFET